jgi:hypothetical protein
VRSRCGEPEGDRSKQTPCTTGMGSSPASYRATLNIVEVYGVLGVSTAPCGSVDAAGPVASSVCTPSNTITTILLIGRKPLEVVMSPPRGAGTL